jgi:hypothetical protein
VAITELQIDYSEILERIGLEFPISRTPAQWTPSQANDVALVIRAGLQKFYNPPGHRWSFLRPPITFTTSVSYSTGTVTVVAGVVTLAGGTWPSYADDSWLYLGGIPYSVESRDSGAQLTLEDTSVDASAGTTFTLRRYRYPIPNPREFGGLDGPLYYAPSNTNRMIEVKRTSEQQLRKYFQQSYWGGSPANYPTRHAIWFEDENSAVGMEVSLVLWPPTERECKLTGNVHRVPRDLDETNKYPAGGGVHSQTILAAIMSEAEMILGSRSGDWEKKYLVLLATSIDHDKQMVVPATLGTIPEYPENGAYNLSAAYDDFWLVPEGYDDQIIP